MSSKQLAYAAVNGRQVRFHYLRGPVGSSRIIEGYIVGMDDYHVLVAEPTYDATGQDIGINTSLVTKGRVDYISLGSEDALAEEPDAIRKEVDDIGRSFFRYCNTHYFGESQPTSSGPREPSQ